MALTSKLRQDYAELADGYLSGMSAYSRSEDSIRQEGGTTGLVGKPEDIIEALSSITDPDGEHEVKEPLKESIGAIKELLENPDMYVRNPNDYDEFQGIVTSRIQKKIEDLKALSPEEAQQEQERQQQNVERARQAQEDLANATPPQPGTEAHSLTEGQWLNQQFGGGGNTATALQNNNNFNDLQIDQGNNISNLNNDSNITDRIINDTNYNNRNNDDGNNNNTGIINTLNNTVTQSIRDVLNNDSFDYPSNNYYNNFSNRIDNSIVDDIINRRGEINERSNLDFDNRRDEVNERNNLSFADRIISSDRSR